MAQTVLGTVVKKLESKQGCRFIYTPNIVSKYIKTDYTRRGYKQAFLSTN